MIDILIVLVIGAALAGVFRKMIRDHKSGGGSCGCGSCSGCAGCQSLGGCYGNGRRKESPSVHS